MRRITKRTPNEFIFEYEDARHMPEIKKGEVFKHERQKYRIVHYNQVFGEQTYCSFLVIAKAVD